MNASLECRLVTASLKGTADLQHVVYNLREPDIANMPAAE